jgi:transposase
MEVLMVEPEVVQQMQELAKLGWGKKRIARELGIARNTVRRYVRNRAAAGVQVQMPRRRLDEETRARAVSLFESDAAGNAVVVAELLWKQGQVASVRTIQRAVRGHREQKRAALAATVRFETPPGEQMQIDFGQKVVKLAGTPVRIYVFVAVLGYSRRLYVEPFECERQDEWREGVMNAFRRFGGATRTLLIDNAGALVLGRNDDGELKVQPAFGMFCRDLGVTVKACRPYRARTKGKTESGVKYVKHNALAGREFSSFAALQAHLREWMDERDRREHGTTHEQPLTRFERDERAAMRALPTVEPKVRERRLLRKVANDSFVNVDTVRYSVPHRLVKTQVEVEVLEHEVHIYSGGERVASHARAREPHAFVREPSHYEGLWRSAPTTAPESVEVLASYGRSLDDYVQVVSAGGAR